jgi:hypothetical protein
MWACQEIQSPCSFKRQLDAIRQERAIEFEDLTATKMAFLVKMAVNRSADRNELLERFRTPEFRHPTQIKLRK